MAQTAQRSRGLDRPSAEIESLITALGSHDVLARDRAHHALVQIGQPAVAPLAAALRDDHELVRGEAARALGELRDPTAAVALIGALDDQGFDVRWLAAEGLIALKAAGVAPLLSSLIDASWDNVWLREGAHHILRSLLGEPFGAALAPVVAAIEGVEPSVTVPLAAYKALDALRAQH